MSTTDPESADEAAESAAIAPESQAPADVPTPDLADAPAPPSPAAAPAPATPPAPATFGPFAQGPYAQGPYAQASGPYPAGYDPTFAPIARAPKSPWVAPQRKGAVIGIAIVSALVLLFVGAVAGSAITRHHDRNHAQLFPRDGSVRVFPGPGGREAQPLPQRPERPGPSARPAPPNRPTPTVTVTKTS